MFPPFLFRVTPMLFFPNRSYFLNPRHEMYNISLIGDLSPINQAERSWIEHALRQRKHNIRAKMMAVHLTRAVLGSFCLGLMMLGYLISGEVAGTTVRDILLLLTSGIITTTCSLCLFILVRRNRQAMRSARQYLKQKTNPDGHLRTGRMRFLHDVADNLSYRIIFEADQRSQTVAIQVPPHWTEQIDSANGRYIPVRMAKIEATGQGIYFEKMIKGGMIGTVPIKFPDIGTRLNDAEYILLSAGKLSMEAEIKAGLTPPAETGPVTSLLDHLMISGLFLAAISTALDDHLPLDGNLPISESIPSLWLVLAIAMVLPRIILQLSRFIRHRKLHRFYTRRDTGFPEFRWF